MKTFLTILIMSLTFCSSLISQETEEIDYRKNAIKINPAAFGQSEFKIQAEHYFSNRKSSVALNAALALKDNLNQSINGWKLGAEYRFYLTHLNKANQNLFLGMENFGFYAGLYVVHQDYHEDFQQGYWDPSQGEYLTGEFTRNISAQEGGAMIGLQFDITKRIVIDFNLGGGLRYTNYDNSYEPYREGMYNSYDIFDLEYQGIKPKANFLIGITL